MRAAAAITATKSAAIAVPTPEKYRGWPSDCGIVPNASKFSAVNLSGTPPLPLAACAVSIQSSSHFTSHRKSGIGPVPPSAVLPCSGIGSVSVASAGVNCSQAASSIPTANAPLLTYLPKSPGVVPAADALVRLVLARQVLQRGGVIPCDRPRAARCRSPRLIFTAVPQRWPYMPVMAVRQRPPHGVRTRSGTGPSCASSPVPSPGTLMVYVPGLSNGEKSAK